MIAGRRRFYLPALNSLFVLICAVVGCVSMCFAIPQARGLEHHVSGTIMISDAMWLAVVGYVLTAIVAGRLWRIARARQRHSAEALAAINAKLALAAGDLQPAYEDVVEIATAV